MTGLDQPTIVQAVLYGFACGDALGLPVAGLPWTEIQARYGAAGVRDLPRTAAVSAHTQALLAAGRALTTLAPLTPEAFGAALATWASTQAVAPGPTLGLACVLPLGYVFQEDWEQLEAYTRAAAQVVNGDADTLAAMLGQAYLLKLVLDGLEPIETPYRVIERLSPYSRTLNMAIGRVMQVLEWSSAETALRKIGVEPRAELALSLALYAFLRFPEDYVTCIVRAANVDGPSDVCAGAAGALAAARVATLGRFVVPNDWVTRVELSAELGQLGVDLAGLKLK